MPSRRLTDPHALLAASALCTALVASCGGDDGHEAVYLLSDRTTDAVAVRGETDLRVSFLEQGFDQRRAILQQPSVYRFDDVPAGDGAYLSVAPALGPGSRGTISDGVGVALRCTSAAGEWEPLLSAELLPLAASERDEWDTRRVSLAPCSAPRTSIELETNCGAQGDCRRDSAAWGDPKIVYRQSFGPRLDRLVVLISIDTLRPDRLGVYGAERPTSPRLAQLAADAVVFETAVAPAPWTIPSHASMLTSTHPDLHNATTTTDIRPELPLLSEVLQGAGWTTAGFVDTPWLGQFGFDRGYDHYDAESPPHGSFRRGSEATRQRLLDWLPQSTGEVFVFWHLMDVHGPYGAPAPYGGRFRADLEVEDDGLLEELKHLEYHNYLRLNRFRSFNDLVAAYDEGILHVDAQVGRLLDVLRAAKLYDDALIIVTSDHGESFMDHGVWVGHGIFLTEDEIRVPLLVKLPGNRHAGTRVDRMVRLIDVAPTILDVLGVAAPSTFEGRSLVSPRPGAPGTLQQAAFGVSSNTGARYVRHNRLKLITEWPKPRARVIEDHLRPQAQTPLTERVDDREKLFDLEADPTEANNLSASEEWKVRAEQLRRQMRFHDKQLAEIDRLLARSQAGELSAEEVDRLKSLGYLGGVDR